VPEPTAWKEGDRLGRYELRSRLGEGGAAEVWQAVEHGELGFRKPVALKLLKDTSHDGRVAELLKEARLVASLSHPNVVGIREVADYDGGIYVAMEFVDGGTLKEVLDWLKEVGLTMPASIVTAIGCDILRALEVAHTARAPDGTVRPIIHRDLKPANVLMARAGVAKVADFGLAKTGDETLETMQGKLKGTPAYIPPESWSGSRDFQPTMDLFMVGAIMYECVVGERLFKGRNIASVFKAVFDRTPEQEVRPILKMAPELAPLLRRLLQRDPADRYQSASEVLEDLVRVHADVDVGCDLTTFMSLVPGNHAPAQAPFSPGTLRLPGHTDERWSRFLASRTGMEIPIIEDPLDRTDPGEETTRRDDPAPVPKPTTMPSRRKKRRRKQVPAWKRRMKSPLFWAVLGAGALVTVLAAVWASGL
jgi:serine/threonine protein kinase